MRTKTLRVSGRAVFVVTVTRAEDGALVLAPTLARGGVPPPPAPCLAASRLAGGTPRAPVLRTPPRFAAAAIRREERAYARVGALTRAER